MKLTATGWNEEGQGAVVGVGRKVKVVVELVGAEWVVGLQAVNVRITAPRTPPAVRFIEITTP